MSAARTGKKPKPPAEKVVPPSEDSLPEVVGMPTTPENKWGWIAVGIVSVALLTVSIFMALRPGLSGAEQQIFSFINGWPDSLRLFFLIATIAPESVWVGLVSVVITFLLKMYRVAWQLAVATIAGYALTYIGKEVIGQARPADLIAGAQVRVQESGMGFPSGHTMIVTVIVLVLWPYLPRAGRYALLLVIPLMALSRVYLGVHSPLDVIGGFAVGALVVSAMRCMPGKLQKLLRFD